MLEDLPKDKLINLLNKNPPELYSALSSAISDKDFVKTARTAAQQKKYLIRKIDGMNADQLESLHTAAIKFL